MNHHCQFIIDYDKENEGEPIFCDKPASLRLHENWFCAPHYDIVERGGANLWKDYYGRLWDWTKRKWVDEIEVDKLQLLSIMYGR